MSNTRVFCKTHNDIESFFERYKPKHIFAFNLACELGTLELLGFRRKKQSPNIYDWYEFNMGSQLRASLLSGDYDKSRNPHIINFYDVQALCRQLGMGSLKKVGDLLVSKNLLNYSKLPDKKCHECSDCENFEQCMSENPKGNPKFDCETYAMFDAEIVYKLIEFLHKNWNFTHRTVSLGTFAKDMFDLQHRLPFKFYDYIKDQKKQKIKKYYLPDAEKRIQKSLFAGRSDAYKTGYLDYAYYLDVKSLYPASMLLTNCLLINGVEPCSLKEIEFSEDLSNQNFGWVYGEFDCDDKLWSMPFRYDQRNYYITGNRIRGIYNSMDLVASKSKIRKAFLCWKPTFSKDPADILRNSKYKELFFKKINDNFETSTEKLLGKGVLNALSGKLGQSKPCISPCTNFPAYSSLLANSHLIMRKLFEHFDFIAYIDTDSIFTDKKDAGEYYNINGIPIILDCKNEGGIFIVRSKMYSWKDPQNNKYDTTHAWKGQPSDFTKIIKRTYQEQKVPKNYTITVQKTATPNTHEKQMQKIPLGYFWQEKKNIPQWKLKSLIHADPKRQRPSYQSLQLIAQHTHADSQPHNIAKMPTNLSEQMSFEEVLKDFDRMRKVKEGESFNPKFPRTVVYI